MTFETEDLIYQSSINELRVCTVCFEQSDYIYCELIQIMQNQDLKLKHDFSVDGYNFRFPERGNQDGGSIN